MQMKLGRLWQKESATLLGDFPFALSQRGTLNCHDFVKKSTILIVG